MINPKPDLEKVIKLNRIYEQTRNTTWAINYGNLKTFAKFLLEYEYIALQSATNRGFYILIPREQYMSDWYN